MSQQLARAVSLQRIVERHAPIEIGADNVVYLGRLRVVLWSVQFSSYTGRLVR